MMLPLEAPRATASPRGRFQCRSPVTRRFIKGASRSSMPRDALRVVAARVRTRDTSICLPPAFSHSRAFLPLFFLFFFSNTSPQYSGHQAAVLYSTHPYTLSPPERCLRESRPPHRRHAARGFTTRERYRLIYMERMPPFRPARRRHACGSQQRKRAAVQRAAARGEKSE